MPSHKTIYPCPFSKGYSIPADLAWYLLTFFSLYRLLLSTLFVLLFFSDSGPAFLGLYEPGLFTVVSLFYLGSCVLSGVCLILQKPGYPVQTQLIIFIDILALTPIMHASGGITSGMGMLLAVSTAAGGLLIGGRCAMLFAALATLAILTEQVYSDISNSFSTTAYTYSGVLGAAFFMIALLSYFLGQRSEQSERIINQKEQTILNLEELNSDIIQQLNSGIIITNNLHQISLINGAALKLFNLNIQPHTLSEISKPLVDCFQNWRLNLDLDMATVEASGDSEIFLRFIPLDSGNKTLFMIILEDNALYNQRLQQSKLASLGQLTASIAHEIRNPLSSIQHASQLLAEHPDQTGTMQRLTDIIQNNTKRVNKIIEDILQLSRRQSYNRKKIKLNLWLDQYLEDLIKNNDWENNLFFVENQSQYNAYIDPDHLKQILDNLCYNAVKYGKQEDGLVILKVTRDIQSICLDVIDNGPGIEFEKRKHLFEPFFTTSSTGTGLGLYISKELAELNQAKLSYQTTKTGGSCFRLRLSEADNNMIEI